MNMADIDFGKTYGTFEIIFTRADIPFQKPKMYS